MRRSFFLLILLACVPFLACSSKVYLPEGAVVQDGKYDTAFPQIEAAAEFEDILSSIRMINSVAYYKHLLFARESGLTQADLNNEKIEEKATSIDILPGYSLRHGHRHPFSRGQARPVDQRARRRLPRHFGLLF